MKGLITAAGSNAVVAPAGTLTGTALATNVVGSSLTGVGTLTSGATGSGFTINLGSSTITGTLPSARLPSPFTSGAISGNTSTFATASGTLTNGHCVQIDSGGNFVDAGGACTVGGGGGTVNAGTAGQVAYYASSTNAVSGESLSALLDSALGNTQGDILYRGASAWSVLAPGTSGNFLQTQGAAANPQWAAGNAGTVTTTGSPASGNLAKFSGATSVANGDLERGRNDQRHARHHARHGQRQHRIFRLRHGHPELHRERQGPDHGGRNERRSCPSGNASPARRSPPGVTASSLTSFEARDGPRHAGFGHRLTNVTGLRPVHRRDRHLAGDEFPRPHRLPHDARRQPRHTPSPRSTPTWAPTTASPSTPRAW